MDFMETDESYDDENKVEKELYTLYNTFANCKIQYGWIIVKMDEWECESDCLWM